MKTVVELQKAINIDVQFINVFCMFLNVIGVVL